MSSSNDSVIIIKKKSAHHGGHHGGAWKVAYADFVTAMMALFIVLWLMTASQDVQKAISGYFKDPKGSGAKAGSSMGGEGENFTISKNDMHKLKDTIAQAMRKNPEFAKLNDHVKMTVTGEGLRIELLESKDGMFFDSGQAKPTKVGEDILRLLAQQLGQLANNVMVEGHTDSKPYDSETYSNWELSADRANAARRIMEADGLRKDQVKQVRGFADQRLRVPEHPEDPSNRRVSIIVQYEEGGPPPKELDVKDAHAEPTSVQDNKQKKASPAPPPDNGKPKEGEKPKAVAKQFK